eukprot:TRINITY_DN9367_c0_g1_i1.p2 TRINITY_DN9367_c0_g1~~TRINITY_DN9367_c0_g1_i1.p2  ORF type:complete len:110 (+),score=15.99 TRINITY_DN9367_c0_g1_i1:469-798(+)
MENSVAGPITACTTKKQPTSQVCSAQEKGWDLENPQLRYLGKRGRERYKENGRYIRHHPLSRSTRKQKNHSRVEYHRIVNLRRNNVSPWIERKSPYWTNTIHFKVQEVF